MAAGPLEVSIGGDRRMAWADPAIVGPCEVGDEVIVNTEALDLGLGSGGFDIVMVNLTRGLDGTGAEGEHVMKLNYSPIQHPVGTVEREAAGEQASGTAQPQVPVLAIGLHGHLAPAAWACALRLDREFGRRATVGYVQTEGGALPGSLSRDVRDLLARELIAGHVTSGATWGGQGEAITLVGALDAAGSLGWDAVIAGPGPGILGSATTYGHGGMAALDVAHAGLSLGAEVVLSPRLSSSDPRPRHRGLSHHTRSVIRLLLGSVEVPLPEGSEEIAGVVETEGRVEHRIPIERVDLDGYIESGLPSQTMGRQARDDPDFFAGPLAAGSRLAELIAS